MIVGSALLGPIPFIATAAGAAIGFGIGQLINKADEHLNDNKMALGYAKMLGVTEENSPAASASKLHFN